MGAAKPLGWRGYPAAENSRRPPLRPRFACRPIALWKAAGVAPFRQGSDHANRRGRRTGRQVSDSSSGAGLIHRDQESGHVLRGKLDAQGRAEFIDAESTEVFVEVVQRRRQRARSCCTRDEGRSLEVDHIGGDFKQPYAASAKSRGGEQLGKSAN